MIFTCHLLAGAVLVVTIKNLPLAFLLAFLSHYFLDFIPHWEYSIKNIKERRWEKSFPDFLKVFLDISFGISLILLFQRHLNLTVFLGAFLATLSDGLTFLYYIFPNNKFLKKHQGLHRKVHSLFNQKNSFIIGGIATQLTVVVLAILFLL